ncbi:hypothetical protein N656DRAFT_785561 [Canariomyces notabilis]|uniref:Uncharacterized protein n=1 Tax=Canariomyces notabilis TaxID=2074819 RepID=A0AAN6QGY2_9PEZI|nr:hypothetical protein N656DRAFT_785561 [Canariomyces arenarius]
MTAWPAVLGMQFRTPTRERHTEFPRIFGIGGGSPPSAHAGCGAPSAAAAAAAASAFRFLDRIKYRATSRAAIPITPNPTPTPMPAAAPVERPGDDAWSGKEGPSPVSAAVAPLETVAVEMDGEVGVDMIDEEVEVEVEVEVEAKVEDVVNVDDVVELVVCNAMFHPTTAMALTVELLVSVVAVIFQAFEAPGDVEANVRTAPEGTSERQSPATEPGYPCAR